MNEEGKLGMSQSIEISGGKQVRFAITKIVRAVAWVILAIGSAYFAQFFWGAIHMGQGKNDYVWELLAHETLSRQYNGLPQMRVVGGGA